MHPNTSLKAKPHALLVSNSQIEQLIAKREAQKGLRDRLKLMDEAVEKAQLELIELIDRGADLSQCGYGVAIQETKRRYPSWRDAFVERMGKSQADAVLESTPESVHRKLVIS